MINHEKRYMIILEVWNSINHSISPNISYNQYDTLEEIKDATQMITDMYYYVLKPERWNNGYFWGYVILDFDAESILADAHDGLQEYSKLSGVYKTLKMKDDFFRKDDEIPAGYDWAEGEYDGWLQYRWGDGKNAVTYTKAGEKIPVTANMLMFGTVKAVYGDKATVKSNKCKKKLSNLIKEDEQ